MVDTLGCHISIFFSKLKHKSNHREYLDYRDVGRGSSMHSAPEVVFHAVSPIQVIIMMMYTTLTPNNPVQESGPQLCLVLCG